MTEIRVDLGERSYPVRIAPGLIDQIGSAFSETFGQAKAVVITDDNVAPLYLGRALESLRSAGIPCAALTLPHGESLKCLARLEEIYHFLSQQGISRGDALVLLGGGVIGDLGGLAAATWMRGIRFMQVPTTLLSQVDSSVGGKVAVDLPEGKNLVGAFHQPSVVLADPETLLTLTDHFWRDGMGEVIKYGCITDAPLFDLLSQLAPGGRSALMAEIDTILAHCVRAKAEIVSQDERDTGLRAILNFGHTLGHATEACQRYQGLSHGAAVAVGMAQITRVSESRGITEAGTLSRLLQLEETVGLPREIPEGLHGAELTEAMSHDKKKQGDRLNLVLLERIGQAKTVPETAAFFASCLPE